jgi:hypothetical protein
MKCEIYPRRKLLATFIIVAATFQLLGAASESRADDDPTLAINREAKSCGEHVLISGKKAYIMKREDPSISIFDKQIALSYSEMIYDLDSQPPVRRFGEKYLFTADVDDLDLTQISTRLPFYEDGNRTGNDCIEVTVKCKSDSKCVNERTAEIEGVEELCIFNCGEADPNDGYYRDSITFLAGNDETEAPEDAVSRLTRLLLMTQVAED